MLPHHGDDLFTMAGRDCTLMTDSILSGGWLRCRLAICLCHLHISSAELQCEHEWHKLCAHLKLPARACQLIMNSWCMLQAYAAADRLLRRHCNWQFLRSWHPYSKDTTAHDEKSEARCAHLASLQESRNGAGSSCSFACTWAQLASWRSACLVIQSILSLGLLYCLCITCTQ